MACSIIRNKSGEIKTVLAANGKDSILYQNILEIPAMAGDKEQALRMWAIAYTPEFKNRHGDWENDESTTNLGTALVTASLECGRGGWNSDIIVTGKQIGRAHV